MAAPPHIVFDCEVITPMFLAGADPNSAELRAASVRGMLRYWYRALLGGRGYTGTALAEAESVVFGSAGMGGITARASAVDVVTKTEPGARIESSKEWHHGKHKHVPRADILKMGSGTGYLWYSAALGDNDRGRGFLPDGTGFQVALVAPRGDTDALVQAGAAFWLLANLGGLGTRSRSGAGSFWVRGVKTSAPALAQKLPAFTADAKDSDDLMRFLEAGLARVVSLAGSSTGEATSDFDVMAAGKTSIVIARFKGRRGVDAASTFGKALQAFRSGSTGYDGSKHPQPAQRAEMHAIKRFVHNGTPPPAELKSAGFGLPLQLQFLRHPNKSNYIDDDDPVGLPFSGGTAEISAPGLTRRASPLQVHVARGTKGYFGIVLTTFNSTFLPGGSRDLKLKAGRYEVRATLGRDIIDTFRREVIAAPDDHGTVWMRVVNVPE